MRRLLLLLALLAAGTALAQRAGRPTPADRFHEAARLFVAGDTARAARAAEAGLALAPTDPQLRALLAEIRRRPPPQPQGGGGGQEPPDRDRPDPPGRDPQQGPPPADRPDPPAQPPRTPPQPPGRDGPDDAGRPQPDPATPPRTPPTQPGAGAPDDRDGQDRPDVPPADGRPSRMTRAEAEALLRALGADERRLLRARQRPTQPREVEKDW